MRRLLASLALGLAFTLLTLQTAAAQTTPQFRLGFAELASMIPAVVGSPLEDEHSDPATGNSIQRTSTGILVWRKADNTAAFTDGSTTWLIGPLGLQSRPNAERFSWEQTVAGAPPPEVPAAGLPEDAVSVSFKRVGGSWTGEGTIKNTTGSTVDAEINVAGYQAPGGAPVIDTPTVFVNALAPGSARSFSVSVPAAVEVAQWRVSLTSRVSDTAGDFAMDVGTSRRLDVAPMLAGAVDTLRRVEAGQWLLRVAAEHRVRVMHHFTPPGVLGSFDSGSLLVIISNRLDSTSAAVRAAVLAHELSHANSVAAGTPVFTPLQCYREEAQAFRRQAEIWRQLWGNKLPPSELGPYYAEMNDITETVLRDPESFAETLASRYRSECGPLASPPSAIMQGQ